MEDNIKLEKVKHRESLKKKSKIKTNLYYTTRNSQQKSTKRNLYLFIPDLLTSHILNKIEINHSISLEYWKELIPQSSIRVSVLLSYFSKNTLNNDR